MTYYSDPSFVSADTMSNTEAVLGPHYQHTSEKPIEVKTIQAQLAAQRPQSLGLPLRMRDEGTEPGTKKSLKRSSTHPTDLLRDSYPHDTVDADPSAALTSRIAASILREGYGVRAAKATVPLKVQDAVERCLQEVSTTVQKEHPPWALPQYRPRDSKPYPGDSDSQSRTSEVLSDPEAPVNRTRYGASSGEDEDPFAYDNSKEGLYQKLYGFGSGGRGMRATLHEASKPYSCPFRKRNPVMFNVRDHEHCAKRPFFGMQELNAAPDNVIEDGITEEMDRALAERTPRHSVKTWEQIWKLLFPQDVSALDSEYLPVVEMVEMEQKLDDSQAELRTDLSESLRKLLPEQSEDVCFFLAGQFQLVFEQHRAKVNRKCRISVNGGTIPSSAPEKSRRDSSRMSRFSMRNFDPATLKAPNIHGRSASQLSSPRSQGRRQSQAQAIPPRTTVSPASTSSSVYSQDPVPAVSSRSRTTTRSSTFSMSGIQVESPRLPFKDWVQGVKFNATNSDEKNYQRDSGLAMEQCEACQMEPCQCDGYNGYADQLSAFMTPAPNTHQPPSGLAPHSAMGQVSEDEEVDWAAQYANQSSTPGAPPAGQRLQMKGSRMGLNAQSAQANRLAPAAGQAQQGFI
ncbi:hypothetical protein SLS63_007165 [Diaporthe eres]|uniref:Uncharacterized protein n=1 Tax=Diaporthe eres TaxID=83184 RepID=A0ABR1P6Q0_DIAER